MTNIVISNNEPFHFEVVESVFKKFRGLFNISDSEDVKVFLHLFEKSRVFLKFKEYFSQKYPEVVFGIPEKIDYVVHCTIYDRYFPQLDMKPNSNTKYIAHDITPRLITNPNVYFVTDLAPHNVIHMDVLPFSDQTKFICSDK